ncbi:hypothetical protein [Cellulomonas iranensis]|uniref:hypothetical protein n=1 Tax=Cellulomonas iranensis TaxID=76862 RepID=UPI0023F0CE15|nr:hypothetical protein [Cellulomonas iranensis]
MPVRADGAVATWWRRRLVPPALLAAAGAAAAGALLPATVLTPQLRGGELEATTAVVVSFAVATCLVPPLVAGDVALEARSPRPVRALRAGLGALLLVVTCALVVASALVRGGDVSAAAAAARTLVVTAALALTAARVGGTTAGFSAVLAYLGCCLFAGASPDGTVEAWARPLAPWRTLPDLPLVVVGAAVVVALFAARPRHASRRTTD